MTEQAIIEITEKAVLQIENIFENDESAKGKGLRVGVVGGGCSGLSYKIQFDEKKESDNVFNFENFFLCIDPKSSIYLKGVILDYKDGLNGKGFIFINPSAKNTCGCGESFSV